MKAIRNYSDAHNNIIITEGNCPSIDVFFQGKNNVLIINGKYSGRGMNITFPANHGVCILGEGLSYTGRVRIGHECLVIIGPSVTCTSPCAIFTAEKTKVIVGDDCMIASGNHIRTEDSHAIYDVESGQRLNKSRDVFIGKHVWLAENAVVLSGTTVNYGSTVGFGSVLKGRFPNNAVIAGTPGHVVKRNTIWERPNIAFSEPWV